MNNKRCELCWNKGKLHCDGCNAWVCKSCIHSDFGEGERLCRNCDENEG